MTIAAACHESAKRVRAAVFAVFAVAAAAAAAAAEYCMSDEQWTEERSLSRQRPDFGVIVDVAAVDDDDDDDDDDDAQSELRLA